MFYKHSASVGDLPSDWKFDLVVSNPPFWNLNLGQMITRIRGRDKYRRAVDNDWQIHRDFFANIGQHMNDNGIILLQEASNASGPDTFRDMIEQNGMYISNYYWEPRIEKIYYLEIKKA